MKPHNVLRASRRSGRDWVVADWGSATFDPDGNPAPLPGLIISPLYMAPERVSGISDPHKVDQWSMGIMLWQAAASGQSPYEGANTLPAVYNAAILGNIRRFRSAISDRDRLREVLPFEPVTRRAAAVEPDERFASVADFGIAVIHATKEATTLRRTHRVAIPVG